MSQRKTLISLISPCFNEENNIPELYERVSRVIAKLPSYDFEYIFIDNASTDNTEKYLREIAARDPRVKVILNNRNFGQIRSPYWGFLQTRGDATIIFASDLQDPPEMIPEFIESWEKGAKIVLGVKPVSKTNIVVHFLRRMYYRVLNIISDVPIVKDATGFGLYDQSVVRILREVNDPYPFLRGLICELGFPIQTVAFDQPQRIGGISKNNFFSLYEVAMLGIVSHSIMPVRLAAILGFISGFLSIVVAIAFLVAKLLFWEKIPIGIAPIIIGVFFMFGLVLMFIGILGEYIGSIHTYVRRRPIVIERDRVNF